MDKGFQFGMKVKLQNEYGVVIQPQERTGWDKEPGIIRWDTKKSEDNEDWRGLLGSFIDNGGELIDPDFEFEFITNEGKLKNG